MAYLRDLQRQCQSFSCKSRASVELMDRSNFGHGYYCKKHGKGLLERLQRVEQSWKRAEGKN